MSNSKHTPGPWKSELHEGEYLIFGATEGHQHFTAIARYEPNARLIAAAPEMLEELEFLIERCIVMVEREYVDGSTYEVENIKAYETVVKSIKEVIAKARGES